jgi:hypothetical protein
MHFRSVLPPPVSPFCVPITFIAFVCVRRPCAKEGEGGEEEAAKDSDDDPVAASMSISYVLPDGTEVTAPEPCVVARGSGPVPVAWESPEHALKVDEALLRKLAECPRLAVKFTRDGAVDAETGDKGEDVTHVVELELARIVLGSKRNVVATVIGDAAKNAPMPAAFAGFTMATLMLRLDGDDAFTPPGRVVTHSRVSAWLHVYWLSVTRRYCYTEILADIK